ncbi:apolipoprotein N-acyltransferase [Oceanomicrobium pacificus]|uniref:Apolipoprotein N-acyltransferase n=1 Tax=Oceanomicrobium pacificus TaxID=2692916 RepID=A0A6B0TZX6_9RHOB|nr:apolipoprotein N-acyltransferase [Oceanomicrobium pacificus]MXU64441.1 apolipoprotein N-acyltransferase [Oceanomicrobium pacificus]
MGFLGPVFTGALLGLVQAPFGLWPFFVVALPLAYVAIARTARARSAAWTGWRIGLGYFAITLFWIVEPFLVDPVRHGWMAPFALAGMAGGLALFWAAGFALARAVARPGPWLALALAAGWALSDLGRAWLLTGFPWALPAYGWIGVPPAQMLALAGPHGLGLLTLLAGLLPASFALRRTRLAAAACALACVALLWGWGAARIADTPEPATDAPVLRIVQPNAPQRLKWDPDWIPTFYGRLLDLSAAPADPPPDLVIWPETAVPVLLGRNPEVQAEMAAATGGAPLVTGIRRVEPAGEIYRWFNTLAVLGEGGAVLTRFDKAHLVPFGEYMPFRRTAERAGLGALVGLAGSFSAGPGQARIDLPGVPPFQPLICYEAIFPQEMLRGPERPDWLLQITNDAWFGTYAGPFQHLAQARARAIEQGLPLVRSANTGISAVIDASGVLVDELPLGEAGRIDAPLPPPRAPTLYARASDLPILVLMLLLLGLSGAMSRKAVARSR